MPPILFLYTALECEAKSLIDTFSLKKENSAHPFSIYKNDQFILTVSGVGKVTMAAAVAYTQALFQKNPFPILINIGIAGHSSLPLGELVLATKIIDHDTQKVFYPQLIKNKFPKTCTLQTLSKPSTNYPIETMSDMEASAFYETAIKFSSSELIHAIKIISDNQTTSLDTITPKLVKQWVSHCIPQITQLLDDWISLQKTMPNTHPTEFDAIIKQWHFSVSGQVKLKSLLGRWQLLSSIHWFTPHKTTINSSKAVLQQLETDIDALKIHL